MHPIKFGYLIKKKLIVHLRTLKKRVQRVKFNKKRKQ